MGALEDCVSAKIPTLLAEGMDQDQAVAAAYSMCSGKQWDALTDDERAVWLQVPVKSQRRPTQAMKRLDNDRIGGYGVVFGDDQQRDLDGEWFTPKTFLGRHVGTPADLIGKSVSVGVDWLFDHTLEDLPKPTIKYNDYRDYIIGEVDKAEVDEIGVWIEAQRQRHDAWSEAVMQLVDEGMLLWSSGADPGKVKRTPDGEITVWPVVEWSSTPTPAEPRHTQNMRVKHYADSALHKRFEDKQDTTPPPGGPAQGARADQEPDIQPTKANEETHMSLQMNDVQVKAIVRAYAEASFEAIKSAVEGKQGNMIVEALQPLAAELAAMTGVAEDQTLAYLVEFVASHAAGEEEVPAPEGDGMGEGEPAMLSVNEDRLHEIINQGVAKAMQDLLPERDKAGKSVKDVHINFNRDDGQIKTLTGLVRAIRDHDHTKLNPYAKRTKSAYKALGINPDTAGGYLVPVEQSNQTIELLRDTAKVFPLCREIPMNSDTVTIPRQTGGATAYWVGENASITASQESFGQVTLVARKLAGLVQISNELIEDSDPAVDALVREDLARVLALELDRVILEGSGLAGQPTGLLNLGCTTTALNAAPTYANLVNAVSRVEVANVMENPAWQWAFNPREKATFRQIQDAQGAAAGVGAYIWTEMGSTNSMVGGYPPQLLGFPWVTTTQITPDSTDNNETEIYFGQWNDVLVGVRKTIELMASNEAGNAFQYDQTWLRAIMRVDVNIRHLESIEILTDVRAS